MSAPGAVSPDAPPAGSVRDWLDAHAAARPGQVSHRFPGTGIAFTWAALREAAHGIAARLAGLGIAPGESVALMLPNGPAAVTAIFGALCGGFRLTEINLAAGPEAVGYALGHSRARVVLCGADQRALLDEATAFAGAAPPVVPVEGARILWPDAPAGALPPPPAPGAVGLLMYTSGTTGRPKGVVHTHASLLAGGWTTALAHRLTPDDTALCVLPHYHINGFCVTLMGPLVSGGCVAMAERFSASRFWVQAGEAGATWFSVVPTIVSHLLQGGDPPAAALAGLRFGRSASSALSPDVHAAFEARFGLPLIETMGLTETAAQILSNPLPPGERRIGSPGIAYGNAVIVADREGRELPRGTEGEVLVRGPNVMSHYLDNPEATAEALTPDGWLRTGDLGRMDAQGYVFITGRIKELIIRGGENIAPREVDDALYAHGDVVEAAAFPRPCPVYGQRVEAAVVLRPGSPLDEAALREHCLRRLGAVKCPERIHLIAGELPKGPSGKIQRRRIAEITG